MNPLVQPPLISTIKSEKVTTKLISFNSSDLGIETTVSNLPRKEVIQPHLPVRLPCYDFTPVINPALGGCLLKG